MKRIAYVGLLLNYAYTFYRDVVRGVRQYAETNLSIESVARHAGFSSARHLGAAFQRQVGTSPSRFRRGSH